MSFDPNTFLASLDSRLLEDPEGRRILTRLSPLAFAWCYLPHHLRGKETGNAITFSEFHLDVIELAKQWIREDTEPMESRDAFVAPRGVGKSTWLFLILPLWAAAHGHRRFAAAFADSGSQAEMHLQSFKHELETNALLRQDYPDLCSPLRRPAGVTAADNRAMYLAKSGFIFSAKGIDSSSLGMKVGELRPDLLILDDVEPDESNYSAYQKDQRLKTILAAILPLNVYARVIITGTVSMPGSIIHDLVKHARGEEPPEWVAEERIRTHWYPAILTDPETGEERSLWPAKWSMTYMAKVRHTRAFRSQMMNDPQAYDGDYWVDTDFIYEDIPVTHQILSIDPAVTSKKKSDFTALAVIGFNRPLGKCVVRDAWALKIRPGKLLRQRVLLILDLYPEISGIVIETNQGGDTWLAILHDMPCAVKTVSQSEAKEVRAGSLLVKYQRGKVVHAKKLPALESQMVAFPKGANDDLCDAVGTGVTVFLKDDRRNPKVQPKAVPYA